MDLISSRNKPIEEYCVACFGATVAINGSNKQQRKSFWHISILDFIASPWITPIGYPTLSLIQ